MEHNENTQIFKAYQQQEPGEVTFEDLPGNIQEIAAETLKSIITANTPDLEQAVESARSVRKAFIHLYKADH
ncbi:hypothetical protein AB3M75_04995 [Serratia ureilytica]|uniref:hypothetical protein n=1 Tax=Serratia ureilytica TaxID=300181 RepID=UPI00371DA6B6